MRNTKRDERGDEDDGIEGCYEIVQAWACTPSLWHTSPRGYAQKIGLVDSCHHYDKFPVALRPGHVLGFPLFIP